MNIKKKKICCILSIMLILAIFIPQFAFAGNDDDPVTKGGSIGNDNLYMLAVSTGNGACDYVDKIIVKYLSNDDILRVQNLDPTSSVTSYRIDLDSEYISTDELEFSFEDYTEAGGPAYLGNINVFNRAIISSGVVEQNDKYSAIYKDVFAYNCKDFESFLLDKKLYRSKDEFFRSNSVEYICFSTEDPIKTLVSIEFVLRDNSQSHVCDWSLNGWKCFELLTIPGYRNYAYLSNRLGISFSGKLIAQSLKMMDGEYPGFDKKDGISHVIFTDLDAKHEASRYSAVDVDENITEKVYSFTYNDKDSFAYTAYDMTSIDNDTYNGMKIGETYTTAEEQYIIKIDLSSQGGSGIERFLSYDGESGIVFADLLTAEISYTDIFGYSESVIVPVISNAIMEYALMENSKNVSMNDSVLSKKAVYAYAQEGSSLMFRVNFQNIKTMDSVKISYKNDADPTDEIVIEKVEAYKAKADLTLYNPFENKQDNGIIDMCIKDYSWWDNAYMSDINQKDITVKHNGAASFELSSGKQSEYSDSYENTYLVILETSNVPDAGTTENVYFRYSYMDTYGQEQTSEECVLTDLCEEFYGYNRGIVSLSSSSVNADTLALIQNALPWSSARIGNFLYYSGSSVVSQSAIAIDVNYLTHMAQGSTMVLVLHINNLEKFTGFSFRMENGKDIWQLESLSTARLINLGERTLKKLKRPETVSYTINNTEYSIKYGFTTSREYVIEDYILHEGINLLMQNNNESKYEIENEKIDTETSGRNYLDYYLDMDYSKAVSGLQFDTAAMHYDVRVTVAGSEDSTADDDAGSGNLFYFQLVFKNGVSAFVLANQQLQSDGFRAGKTENFSITTNENFGDITAIRIIPDEVSDSGDKLDKLKIDQIEVVSSGPGQPKKSVLFYNIGWIGSEYFETAGTKGRSGKTLQEASTTVSPSSNAEITSLEFSILTGGTPGVSDQFTGSMSADIVYINSKNETTTLRDIDVVAKIYEYMERDSGTVKSADKKKTSDSTWMFRPGHADRFIIDLTDVKRIVSLKLYPSPEKAVTWKVDGISIRKVDEEGQLYLDPSGDFQRKVDDEKQTFITDTVSNRNMPASFTLPAGDATVHTFTFAGGDVPDSEETKTGLEYIARVPESSDDSVNIFMYMAEGGKSPEEGNYGLNMTMKYSSISTGKSYTRTIKSSNPNCTYRTYQQDGKTVLCYMGVSANYLSRISVFMADTDNETEYAKFEKIVVQHVRSNTIINTYTLSLFSGNASSRYGLTAYEGVSSSVDNMQVLTLHLAEDSPAFSIVAEKRDIAASLIYTSDQDPDKKTEYTSKNVFLSDDKIFSVAGGSMLQFTFDVGNIEEIKGIKLSTLNGASCIVDAGVLECYESNSNGEQVLTKYISINPGADTEVIGSVIFAPDSVYDPNGKNQPIANKLHRVDLTFATMNPNAAMSSSDDSSSRIDSNGSAPIKMKINYVADISASATVMKSITYDDIRKLAGTDGDFTQGGSATVSLFIEGLRRISSVELIPDAEDEESASWNLESIAYSISDSDYENERTLLVNTRITNNNNAGTFYLSDMSVNLTVSGGGINTTGAGITVSDSTYKTTANPSDVINIFASVKGTYYTYGYKYKVEKVLKNTTRQLVYESDSLKNKTGFEFKLPAYDYDRDSNEYIVTVYAEENPNLSAAVDVVLVEPDLSVEITVNGGTGTPQSVSNGALQIAAQPGETLDIDVRVNDTFEYCGYNYKVERVTYGENVLITEKKSNKNNTSFTYVLPEYDYESSYNRYIITVTSEENPLISSKVTVSLIGSDTSVDLTVSGETGWERSVSNGNILIFAEPGEEISVAALVQKTHSAYGYNYKIERVSGSSKTLILEKNSNKNDTAFKYKLPEYNFNSDSNTYLITVSSEETPGLCSTVEIRLSKPEISVDLVVSGGDGAAKKLSNSSVSINAASGATLSVDVIVKKTGEKFGYGYKLEKLTDGENELITESASNKNNTSFEIKLPEYISSASDYNKYILTVYSTESSSVSSKVNITVTE